MRKGYNILRIFKNFKDIFLRILYFDFNFHAFLNNPRDKSFNFKRGNTTLECFEQFFLKRIII